MQRMEERSDLPAAEMRGQQQHSFAALLRRFKIFKALIHRDPRRIRARVAWKQARFAQQSSQRNVNTAQNSRAARPLTSLVAPSQDCNVPRVAIADAEHRPAARSECQHRAPVDAGESQWRPPPPPPAGIAICRASRVSTSTLSPAKMRVKPRGPITTKPPGAACQPQGLINSATFL